MKRKFGFSHEDLCQWITSVASLATMVLAIMILVKLNKKEKFSTMKGPSCVEQGQKDSNAKWQDCQTLDYNSYRVV
jgi:hypothetical protein